MATKQDIAYLSDIGEEATIPSGATQGNLVEFGEGKVLHDSGKKISDLVSNSEIDGRIDDKINPAVGSVKAALVNQYAVAAYKSAEWVSGTSYDGGDFCMHEGSGYRAIDDTESETFEPGEWELVLSSDGKAAIDNLLSGYSTEGKAALLDLAPAFANVDYEVGNLVVKNGKIQICTVAGRGAGATFSADNATVDAAITKRLAPYKAHVENNEIHVSPEDRENWNAKQDAISDLSDIREKANEGADAARRDLVVIEPHNSVKACGRSTEEYGSQVGYNTPGSVVSANGFKLNLRDYCAKLLTAAQSSLAGVVPKRVWFSYISIYLRGSTEKAKLVICRSGSSEIVAQSNVITLNTSSSGSINIFDFTYYQWLDADGEYEFKILNEDGSAYISGLYMRFGSTHISVYGFATNVDGGDYTSREGCFTGAAGFRIEYYNNVVDLAAKSEIPTKTSQLTNDSGFITESAIPDKVSDFTNDAGYITANDVKDKADSSAIAPEYDTSDGGYSVGETCMHNGKYYKCTSVVLQDEEWDDDDWEETSLEEIVASGAKQIKSNWNESDPSKPSYIENKPTIPAAVTIDSTLSHQGQAADAKATGDALKDKASSDSIDNEYDTSSSGYDVGQTCMHEGLWYECVKQVAQNAVWNPSSWKRINLVDELENGRFQVQSDWNQNDANDPAYIKNKPTIPAAVTIDSTLSHQGQAADAKATGDALTRVENGLGAKASSRAIDDAYDTASSGYDVGDTCVYDGKWYKCKSTVSTGESWSSLKWDEISVKDVLSDGAMQVQSDWNESDADDPAYIKNKPAIPAAVTIDPTLSHQGQAADAKATGDALKDKASHSAIDYEYDTSSGGYDVGETCIHNGKWYKSLSQVAKDAEWDDSSWEEINLAEELENGSYQKQADWNQNNANDPSFIKNKPTIPAAVTIDSTLSHQGQAADAKSVGDKLADKANTSAIDKEYNTVSSGYSIGNTCIHDGKWYKCKASVALGEAWSSLKWDEISVKDVLSDGAMQVQSDWNESDADDPAYIKNKPTIPASVTIDSTLTHQGQAADAKATGDALANKISAGDLPYAIVELSNTSTSGNVMIFQLQNHAVNVMEPTVGDGKTIRLIAPAKPSSAGAAAGTILARDFYVSFSITSEEDVPVSASGMSLEDYIGSSVSITAPANGRATYRFTEIAPSGSVFLVTLVADPSWKAVKEFERALDDLLDDGGAASFTPGVFIPGDDGLYYKLVAVTDPETGEVNIGVDQEGVEK